MQAPESIHQFLYWGGPPDRLPTPVQQATRPGQFNVYDVENFCMSALAYNRRDFYKISLLTGAGQLHYADGSVRLDRPALVFTNPLVPYA